MDEQEFTSAQWKRYWRLAKMKPTYHLRGTPWPLHHTGPYYSVVIVKPTETKGRDIAWFFRKAEATEYISILENRMTAKEKRRKK